MKYQYQRFGHDPKNGIWGDCYRTCIACLLDKTPEEVPHFTYDVTTDTEGVERAQDWLNKIGLYELSIAWPADLKLRDILDTITHLNKNDVRYMLHGTSPRNVNHTVICLGNSIEWCTSSGYIKKSEEAIIGPMDDGFWYTSFIALKM